MVPVMNRAAGLEMLSDESRIWDVIIIGGGASGLGAALDAADRGYQTLLLEQADFSEGTSSRSTKLVHGGVRYLRNGEIGLVRESLRERGRLLRNAPRLVQPLPFVVPGYRWYERFYYGVGLATYDLLAGNLAIDSTQHLSREGVVERLPNLVSEGLHGGTLYWDAQFDDARVAVALARTADSRGATILNHIRVEGLEKEGGRIRGVTATDQLSRASYRVRGKVVINATGVFTDSIRRFDEPEAKEIIEPSQGIHLVLDREFLGGETAIMIPKTDDGRVLFAIPWLGKVVLGTTDTPKVPVELRPRPREAEIEYLIEHAARYLRKAPSPEDIRATFAGLRPLVRPKTESGSTAAISRDHSLFVSDSGLVTIAGGKWTTYRKMAEDTVDKAIEVGGLPKQPCGTADLTLLDGSARDELPDDAPDSWSDRLDSEYPWTIGDVVAAIRQEMACTVDDVLDRRLRMGFLDEAAAARCRPRVDEILAEEIGTRSG